MKRTSIYRTIILAGMLATSAVSAGTEIVKCVDQDGKVTLTDAACPADAKTAVVFAGSNEPATAPPSGEPPAFMADAAERYTVPRIARRALPVVKPMSASGALSRDVATLKAARQNLRLLDSAAQAMRSQRVALQ